MPLLIIRLLNSKFQLLFILFVGININSLSQGVTIKGNIIDILSQKLISDVNVHIQDLNLGCATNSSGEYSIPNLKKGEYILVASYSGYKTIYRRFLVNKFDVTVNLKMAKVDYLVDEVVVPIKTSDKRLKSSPTQIEVFNEDLIKSTGGSNFKELLTSLSPSLDFNNNIMGSKLQLNGFGNEYILIIVDGKRFFGNVGAYSDLSRINPEDIKKIELIKGAASSLYGSGAIAGVIKITTKKNYGGSKLSIQNNSRITSNSEWRQYNSIKYNANKFSSLTKLSRRQTDGWQLSNVEWKRDKANDKHKKLEPTDGKSVNESLNYKIDQRFEYKFSTKSTLYLTASYYNKEVLQPYDFRRYGFVYQNIEASLGGKHTFNADNFLKFRIDFDNFKYYRKYSGIHNEQYVTDKGDVIQTRYYKGDMFLNSNQKRILSKIDWYLKPNKYNTINSGFEYKHERQASTYRFLGEEVSDNTLALFVQDEIDVTEDFSLVAGCRLTYNVHFGTFITPNIALLYKLSKFNFRLNYSRGHKTPSLKELYYHYEINRMGTHKLYLGNKDLTPQKSNYLAFTIEYNSKIFSTSISTYSNKITDLITYRIIKTEWKAQARGVEETKLHDNFSEAKSKGFDFILNMNLGHGIKFGGGYSYVDSKRVTSEDEKQLNIDNNETIQEWIQMNGTAHHYTNINASWLHKWDDYKLKLSLNGRIQSTKFYNKDIATVIKTDKGLKSIIIDTSPKGFDYWKFNTSHTFKKIKNYNLVINLGIDNVLDYVDRSPFGQSRGTNSPGRTYYISVNIKYN